MSTQGPETSTRSDALIRLTNSMTHRKEEVRPDAKGRIGMYVCGPTVYDRAHLGNARSAVAFDVLFRLLRHVHGAENVLFVRNFTDVDDKINAKAAETGRTIGEITAETAQWYLDDMAAVGVMEPTEMPRATEYIAQMREMIRRLIDAGHAYEAEGHVLFSVGSYAAYGRLSGRSVEDMIAGARVEVAPYKLDPMDFVLWKPSNEAEPGWDSDWGRGRPGWHIECSAMAYELLGESFQIHGGGADLMFPHHENEIAQSCCAHPEGSFAQIWLHNEMLQVEGKKMSKSLGNFFTVRDLLDQEIDGEVIRLVFLGTHYRKPMDWTQEKAETAKAHLLRWGRLRARHFGEMAVDPSTFPVDDQVLAALCDDLNTHAALTRIYQLAAVIDRAEALGGETAKSFFGSLALLGLTQLNPNRPAIKGAVSRAAQAVESLSALEDRLGQLRAAAMESKDFSAVDALKSALLAAGVEVRMSKTGVELQPGPGFDAEKLEALR